MIILLAVAAVAVAVIIVFLFASAMQDRALAAEDARDAAARHQISDSEWLAGLRETPPAEDVGARFERLFGDSDETVLFATVPAATDSPSGPAVSETES
jgi:hypothetical protein